MVSSKDVAKRAGVSQSTVSRVLNASNQVSKTNAEKVTKAMKELNYRPNAIARSLVSKQTKTLALISGPLHNPFFVETTTSIINYANEKGYKTNVFFENAGDNMAVYESVLSMQLDGIILSSIFMEDPIYEELKALNLPFVMFNRKHNKPGHFVEIDNRKAGKLAADHFLELGHKRIGFIGGPLYTSTFHGRCEGFIVKLKEHLSLDDALIHETDTSEKEIREAVLKMMGQKHKPTAIFAATDSIAILAIDVLKELGYDIPDDISICGMDNVRLARHHSFELTTIGQKTEQNLGRLGIEYLIDMLEGNIQEDTPVEVTLEPILYQRKTTCAI
ncbi:LacI family DNA-binding transcriptional regulator [Salibacterium aidingense]|uniref:LacI family DNA-binding transcriptional regulator n=1 Tax=Salibacterium aidingense TaxID=384933 RepID=UPI000427F779|nr:LacI family DNA-binding transcriptional regulator [Salibacterium aidingense]